MNKEITQYIKEALLTYKNKSANKNADSISVGTLCSYVNKILPEKDKLTNIKLKDILKTGDTAALFDGKKLMFSNATKPSSHT